MHRAPTLAVLLVAAVAAFGSGCAPSRTTTPTSTPAPAAQPTATGAIPTPRAVAEVSPAVQRDITYCAPGTAAQKMDVYTSAQPRPGTSPVVLYIHGGAWSQGDKATAVYLAALSGRLVEDGYVVASMNYRLAPQYRWPAQIEDAKCAVRFLRANAHRFAIDPDAIGVVGVSAGGHLAALLGTTDPGAGMEGNGGNPTESSRVQAVVDISGPSDLSLPEFSSSQARVAAQVFGATSPQDPVLKEASPVNHASKGDPPFLIFHGEKDNLVPVHQAEELNDRLRSAGVDSTLIVVRNATHTLSPAGGAMSPSQDQIVASVLAFLDKHLKRGTGGQSGV
ncbi:MAG TPA: alpha/beta hydrolase [Chloroflexota bacterium]